MSIPTNPCHARSTTRCWRLQHRHFVTHLLQPPAWSRTAHTFSHIFAGGYAAGYYSYKWAEVLSADAYAAFEETAGADGTPSIETGRRYRQAILEAGGSRPALASFKAFRGREPSLDALLRHQGMVQPS
jgi:oligopeptidase A